MRLLIRSIAVLPLLALPALIVLAQDQLTIFGHTWTVPMAQDWKLSVDRGTPMLQLVTGREPAPGPRRPSQFALLEMPATSHLTLNADVRPTKRSLIVVFAYQDSAHFDYAHFSADTAAKEPVHNGVFHVYGGERVRISDPAGPAAFPAINQWFHIELRWNGETGVVQGYVDGKPVPALHAVDLSLRTGRLGMGSFDETADFKNVTVAP